jgi:hypothetical protein
VAFADIGMQFMWLVYYLYQWWHPAQVHHHPRGKPLLQYSGLGMWADSNACVICMREYWHGWQTFLCCML